MPGQRRHFVFVDVCGCPLGVAERRPGVRLEDAAWRAMYETRAAERAAAARGVRVVQVDHATYVHRFHPQMSVPCPHRG
jgi:hypothetical protein